MERFLTSGDAKIIAEPNSYEGIIVLGELSYLRRRKRPTDEIIDVNWAVEYLLSMGEARKDDYLI